MTPQEITKKAVNIIHNTKSSNLYQNGDEGGDYEISHNDIIILYSVKTKEETYGYVSASYDQPEEVSFRYEFDTIDTKSIEVYINGVQCELEENDYLIIEDAIRFKIN